MSVLHDYYCRQCNEVEERACGASELHIPQHCGECSQVMERVFLNAPMSFVRPDICYDSPIDGRPITTYQERLDDLARADCVPYEPGIKQDQERNERLRAEALEQAVEKTVEKEIATMPAVKREKLTAELQGGMTAEPARITPPQVSYRDA